MSICHDIHMQRNYSNIWSEVEPLKCEQQAETEVCLLLIYKRWNETSVLYREVSFIQMFIIKRFHCAVCPF